VAASLPRRLAWLTVGALALVMTLGNIVSATGSGLGCPDWPLCHGRVIPPGGAEIWIEFRHRLAVPLFSALLVATAVVTWRRAATPALKRLAAALVGLLVVQIVLGGVTVLLGLSPVVSTVHLLVALSVLAGLMTLCATPDPPGFAWRGAAEGEPSNFAEPQLARFATAGLAVLLIQLALGGYVRHSGAGLACPDFPLCSGDVFPGHWLGWVHWLHRWLGVVLLGFLLHLARVSRRTALAGVGAAVAGLAVAQVTLGILAVLLRLPITVRASHAVVGYALWALLVWIAVRAGAWGASLGSTIEMLGSPSAAPRETIDPLGSPSAAPRQTTAARGQSRGRK
jgi:heme A synthase